jgi:hypothetical protein
LRVWKFSLPLLLNKKKKEEEEEEEGEEEESRENRISPRLMMDQQHMLE